MRLTADITALGSVAVYTLRACRPVLDTEGGIMGYRPRMRSHLALRDLGGGKSPWGSASLCNRLSFVLSSVLRITVTSCRRPVASFEGVGCGVDDRVAALFEAHYASQTELTPAK